jgi:hypothetical protein
MECDGFAAEVLQRRDRDIPWKGRLIRITGDTLVPGRTFLHPYQSFFKTRTY